MKIFKTFINDVFKWQPHTDTRPRLASVFIGSNDFGNIPALDEICLNLRALGNDFPLLLISPIGGMGFFELTGRVNFERIMLTDENIAEHSKAALIINEIIAKDYSKFDAFARLGKILSENPDLLLPKLSQGVHSFEFGENAFFKFAGRTAPAVPIFRQEQYPEFAWRPTEDQYNLTRRNAEKIDSRIFVNLPKINAPTYVVVYFVSNIPETSFSDESLRSMVLSSQGVIPVRSSAGTNATNNSATNVHYYWEIYAKSLLEGKSLHVWADEDAKFIGSKIDAITNHSCKFSELIKGSASYPVDTTLFHMILGKSTQDKHASLLDQIISYFKSDVVLPDKIIFSEKTEIDLESFCQSTDLTLKQRNYKREVVKWVPGGGAAKRSWMLVYRRVK